MGFRSNEFYERLHPVVRKLTRLLHGHGYEIHKWTFESQETQAEAQRLGMAWPVFVIELGKDHPVDLETAADELWLLLENHGVPLGDRSLAEYRNVEARYEPGMPRRLVVSNVTDLDLQV